MKYDGNINGREWKQIYFLKLGINKQSMKKNICNIVISNIYTWGTILILSYHLLTMKYQ